MPSMLHSALKTLPIKTLALGIGFISLFILASTFFAEHFFYIPVCRMCILERYPYLVATLIGVMLFFLPPKNPFHLWVIYLLVLTFAISLGLSCYHIGLEYGWFNLPSFCKVVAPEGQTLEDLRAQILNQKTIVPCNMVPLRIFFLSLAEWNGLASLFLLGASWILLRKK